MTTKEQILELVKKYYKEQNSIKKEYETGDRITYAARVYDEEEMVMEIKGRDMISGLPKIVEISEAQVREALKEPVTKIVEEIKSVLSETPPELASDIIERGIVMTGGGSMLRELPRLISKETGVPVILVEKPLECVAIGAGKAFGLFKDLSSERSIYDSLNN